MDIRNEIDQLGQAITDQCGLMASVTHVNHPGGLRTCQVQICTAADAREAKKEDWVFFTAHQPEDLPRLRDQLATFIANHRRGEAA